MKRLRREVVAYDTWLAVATFAFVLWYIVVVLPVRTRGLTEAVLSVGDQHVPLFPTVQSATIRGLFSAVAGLGLPITVVSFLVGLALFVRQTDA